MRIHSQRFFFLTFILLLALTSVAQTNSEKEVIVRLENPITEAYLKKHLAKKSPKLILTPEIERELKRKLKTDTDVQVYYKYLQAEADNILEKPILKKEMVGFRMVYVSRAMLERMGILCLIYRLDEDPKILKRIDDELNAVCAFDDWNPQHYLDVSEMAVPVALAIDWVGYALPKETIKLAKTSLIEKAIKPSYNLDGPRMGWVNGSNNWNAICHSGLVVASLAIADNDPELAALTISRALEKIPNSLKEYGPDGVHPEGPFYWWYGTSYTVLAANALTTALGTDFGISDSPGFMESASFRLITTAPSSEFFNFADSDGSSDGDGSVLLTWFASKTGDALYYDKKFFANPKKAGRFAGPGLIWLSQFSQKKNTELPLEWQGNGANPIAVFRGKDESSANFYLAVKGGKAHISHGNMDAGTFIFELDGVRWVIDPGNQDYHELNKIGFALSDSRQESERWTLLTKGNHGHSTVTVNNSPFMVDGFAPIVDFHKGEKPEVTIDLTAEYGGELNSIQRKFTKENDRSFLIEDKIEVNDLTKKITWDIMTTADVIPTKNGAILQQDGKELRLLILSPNDMSFSIVTLDPPPLKIDKTIQNLKRIEIEVPAYILKDGKGLIKVRFSGSEVLAK